MKWLRKPWPRWSAFAVFIAAAVYFFLPQLLTAVRAGVGALLYALLCLFGICILPFFLAWFLGFAYWFAKPYFRAWHIRHIRNNRFLKEAAARGKTGDD
jgi:hypothetical protein